MSDPEVQKAVEASPTVKKAGWELEDRTKILFQWELVVRLQGRNAVEAKQYLSRRDGNSCTLCGIIVREVLHELEFDHINGNRRDNRRWNLRLAHHTCNSIFHHRRVDAALSMLHREKESMPTEQARAELPLSSDLYPGWSTRPWSSREGEKHDIQRARWNAWIDDLERGPFRDVGAYVQLNALAKMAVHAIGLGSSVTYRRYAEEDHFGATPKEPGRLEIFEHDGIQFVRYRGSANRKLDRPEDDGHE